MKLARILAAASSGTKSHSASPEAISYTFGAGVVHGHADVAQNLGQDVDILDLGDVGETAPLARKASPRPST